MSTPRGSAFEILVRIERDREFAGPLLERELPLLPPRDRGLLTELVYGVCRRRGTLDHIAAQLCDRPLEKLERSVLVLLRLGLHQLFFLERIPASAAVNETVKLARRHSPRSSGFINAVLRRADRERDAIRYPDREREPARHLAAVHSQPLWLAERWIAQLGFSEAEELARAMSLTPPLTLRVNTLRATREELLEKLAAAGISARAGAWSPCAITVEGGGAVTSLPGYAEGHFAVQDEASQIAALLLQPQPGERVLDACAAPGGKATFLAQLMENRGEVAAGELNAKKLELIEQNLQRLGTPIVHPLLFDAAKPPSSLGSFHRILADVPCSALGVLRRNPEGKWWKTPEDVARNAAKQREILQGVSGCLAPGGTLLYATCSTDPREDEEVVDEFLSGNPAFMLENLQETFPAWSGLFTPRGEFRSWPHRHGMDGFYAARLKKR